MTSLSFATANTERGWRVVPLPAGQEAPRFKKWQELRLDVEYLHKHFNNGQNVGMQIGEPSDGLTDIDQDRLEAVLLAPSFLPETGAIFGRRGKPASHWLYSVEGLATKKLHFPAGRATEDDEQQVFFESGSSGQIVYAGSVHPKGSPRVCL